MRCEMQEGDEVLLILNPSTVGVTDGMWKWDQCRFHISRIVYAGDKHGAASAKGALYYELENCVSEEGVPYAILREWIYPTGRRYE